MLISKELTKAINEEIGLELFASNQYLAIAAYFESLALKKLAAMFYKQSDEERQHALKFAHYVSEAGGTLEIPAVQAPQATFKTRRGGRQARARLGDRGHHALCGADDARRSSRRTTSPRTSCGGSRPSSSRKSARWTTCCEVVRQAGERNLIMLEAYLAHE